VRTWNSTTSEQGRDWEYFEHSPLHSSGIMPFRKAVFEHGKCEKANASNATTHGCSMLQIKLQGALDVSNDTVCWPGHGHRSYQSLYFLHVHTEWKDPCAISSAILQESKACFQMFSLARITRSTCETCSPFCFRDHNMRQRFHLPPRIFMLLGSSSAVALSFPGLAFFQIFQWIAAADGCWQRVKNVP